MSDHVSQGVLYLAGLGIVGLMFLNKPRKAIMSALRVDSKFISDLHPQFQPLVTEWQRRMTNRGIETKIEFTYRSPETQKKLLAEGKTKVDFGWHNVGLAFDFLPKSSVGYHYPQESDSSGLKGEIDRLLQAGGEEGQKLGMTWGGSWSTFVDKFHLEWHPNLTIAQAKQRQAKEGDQFRIA